MLYVLHRYIKPIMYIRMILCLHSKQIHMETRMRKYWMKEMEVQIQVILHTLIFFPLLSSFKWELNGITTHQGFAQPKPLDLPTPKLVMDCFKQSTNTLILNVHEANESGFAYVIHRLPAPANNWFLGPLRISNPVSRVNGPCRCISMFASQNPSSPANCMIYNNPLVIPPTAFYHVPPSDQFYSISFVSFGLL